MYLEKQNGLTALKVINKTLKRLLLLLIAALALPTAVNAESYWLILIESGKGKALEKIEMESMEQCNEQGNLFKRGYREYVCLIGK